MSGFADYPKADFEPTAGICEHEFEEVIPVCTLHFTVHVGQNGELTFERPLPAKTLGPMIPLVNLTSGK
jgi:hypothetical protein